MISIARGLCILIAVVLLLPAPVDELADFEPILHMKALTGTVLTTVFFLLETRPIFERLRNGLVAGVAYFALSTLLRLVYFFVLTRLASAGS